MWVFSLLGLFCVISCFETVTHRIAGQPFCNMSMDALEMIVIRTTFAVCCRLASQVKLHICMYIHIYIWQCFIGLVDATYSDTPSTSTYIFRLPLLSKLHLSPKIILSNHRHYMFVFDFPGYFVHTSF